MFGFYRFATIVPELKIADPVYNAGKICDIYEEAIEAGASIILTPELSLTAYSCRDLFRLDSLCEETARALDLLLAKTIGKKNILIVGLPLRVRSRLFNAAAVLQNGKILGFSLKTYLPNYGEFYEKRQFRSAKEFLETEVVVNGQAIPAGNNLIYDVEGFRFGIEICEDLWSIKPPSDNLAIGGAEILFNLSASPEGVGKAKYRRQLVSTQSGKLRAGYIFCSAGENESSSELVFGGHCIAAFDGKVIAERLPFSNSKICFVDMKPTWLTKQREIYSSFNDVEVIPSYVIKAEAISQISVIKYFSIDKMPFVPSDLKERYARANEILEMQSRALAKRMLASRSQKMVIGLSGGLDSTLALLVCERARLILNLPNTSICAITMPGFGTSEKTFKNVQVLADLLHLDLRKIDITDAVRKHFEDIGHNKEILNVVYENAQARERTQVLMDVANGENGLVIGTGDLSEAALGWCTFNGDQMAMYGVNAGVPKTLVRYIVEAVAEKESTLRDVLLSICNTEISPELLPGKQATESIIGNYNLHDFFLYYFLKYGETKEGLVALAKFAFQSDYSLSEIEKTIEIFFKRFFVNQFKRDTMPNAPKIGTISLSPRGDWRMPSDATYGIFV